MSEVGHIFERCLNIKQNSNPLPDYNNIEIKCKINNQNSVSISLFRTSFDGDKPHEIIRLYDKYGIYGADGTKKLYTKVSGKYKEKIGPNEYAKLHVNHKLKKIQLEIYENDILIDNEASWSFKYLKTRLEEKLQYLAYVRADKQVIGSAYYYKYTDISFYVLRDFNMFLKLIEEGFITVKFEIGMYKSGKRKGMVHNHGIAFCMLDKRLNMLFSKVDLKYINK